MYLSQTFLVEFARRPNKQSTAKEEESIANFPDINCYLPYNLDVFEKNWTLDLIMMGNTYFLEHF